MFNFGIHLVFSFDLLTFFADAVIKISEWTYIDIMVQICFDRNKTNCVSIVVCLASLTTKK